HPLARHLDPHNPHSFPTRRSFDLKITVPGAGGTRLPLVRSERTLFESTEPAPSAEPSFWLPYYFIAGLVIGGAIFGLGGLARKRDRKSTRLNSSHVKISYAVYCLK